MGIPFVSIMEKGTGGSSKQRRAFKRLVARVSEELFKNPPVDILPPTNPVPVESEKNPFKEFWTSTPLWAALGGLLGMISAQLSRTLLFIAVWAILCFEFIRVRISPNKRTRYGLNLAFAVVSACAFFGLQKVIPKPVETPPFDQQLKAFADKFANQKTPPAAQTTNIVYGSIPQEPDPPRLDFEGPYFREMLGPFSYKYMTQLTNAEKEPARDYWLAGGHTVAAYSDESEDRLFSEQIEKVSRPPSPKVDMYQGVQHGIIIPTEITFTEPEDRELKSGTKVLYIGFLATYKDRRGRIHHAPDCAVFDFTHEPTAQPHSCNGHNTIY